MSTAVRVLTVAIAAAAEDVATAATAAVLLHVGVPQELEVRRQAVELEDQVGLHSLPQDVGAGCTRIALPRGHGSQEARARDGCRFAPQELRNISSREEPRRGWSLPLEGIAHLEGSASGNQIHRVYRRSGIDWLAVVDLPVT